KQSRTARLNLTPPQAVTTIPQFQRYTVSTTVSLATKTTEAMPSHAITTLEFDRLKENLLQQIRTPLGASLVEDLEISANAAETRGELRLTGEGVDYLRDGTALDINDLPDPRQPLGKLAIADVNLEPIEILDLLRLISVASGLRETFHGEATRFPLIREITG